MPTRRCPRWWCRNSVAGAITVTRNEILYTLNKPEDFILGIVEFLEDGAHRVHNVREPFRREPDFGTYSVKHSFAELLAKVKNTSVGGLAREAGARGRVQSSLFDGGDEA